MIYFSLTRYVFVSRVFLTSRCMSGAVCVVVCVCLSFAWEVGVYFVLRCLPEPFILYIYCLRSWWNFRGNNKWKIICYFCKLFLWGTRVINYSFLYSKSSLALVIWYINDLVGNGLIYYPKQYEFIMLIWKKIWKIKRVTNYIFFSVYRVFGPSYIKAFIFKPNVVRNLISQNAHVNKWLINQKVHKWCWSFTMSCWLLFRFFMDYPGIYKCVF